MKFHRFLPMATWVFLLVFSATASAKFNTPAVPEVPAGLRGQHGRLLSKVRETLAGELARPQAQVSENYTHCHDVPADDTKHLDACDRDNERLVTEYRQYQTGLAGFKTEIKAARIAQLRETIAQLQRKIAVAQEALRRVQLERPEE